MLAIEEPRQQQTFHVKRLIIYILHLDLLFDFIYSQNLPESNLKKEMKNKSGVLAWVFNLEVHPGNMKEWMEPGGR